MKTSCVVICLLPFWVSAYWAQEPPNVQNKDQSKATIFLRDTTAIRINKELLILPIWVGVSNALARSVKVEIPKIASKEGEIISIKYQIEPESSDISPNQFGKVFKVKFDSSEIKKLEPGNYIATLFISAENAEPVIGKLEFEIPPTQTFLSSIMNGVNWVRNNFLQFLRNIFEILFFVFLVGLIIWFISITLKGSRSLNVLPIVNETGGSGEFEGVASGIDDILITKLQDIGRL